MTGSPNDAPRTPEEPDEFTFQADDPDGARYLIQAVQGYGFSGPVWLEADGHHPLLNALLRPVNRVLAATQRGRPQTPVDLSVFTLVEGREQLVQETIENDMADARKKAASIVDQIAAGMFRPEAL